MPDSTLSTLEKIIIKIRRLTKSPSQSQISDPQISDYINSFILYDLPRSLKLNQLHRSLKFYTDKGVDVYSTSTDIANPLYNLKNAYSSFDGAAYISGEKSTMYFSKEEARDAYPKEKTRVIVGVGNGINVTFNGTLTGFPIATSSVMFSSTNTIEESIKAFVDNDGNITGGGAGALDYDNGDFGIIFATAPKIDEDVYVEYRSLLASKPVSILYSEDSFTVMPTPDGIYEIEVSGYLRPSELLANGEIPDLADWWQYICYGASIRILQDRGDSNGVLRLSPEFENQELLVERRSSAQNRNLRAKTIYS